MDLSATVYYTVYPYGASMRVDYLFTDDQSIILATVTEIAFSFFFGNLTEYMGKHISWNAFARIFYDDVYIPVLF